MHTQKQSSSTLLSSSHNPKQLMLWTMYAIAVAFILLLPSISLAQVSGGLQKSVTTTQQILDWAWLIIPLVCLLSGGVAGVCYSMDIIRKDTLYTWLGGTAFAGLIAGGMVELIF